MLRSLWLLFLYTSFLGLSVNAPFIAMLGYLWVDTFQPQNVAYIVLNQIPVALLMAVAALGTYLLLDRRSPPRLNMGTILQFALAVWVTVTLLWAEVPDAAWAKWDWAVKTLMFAAFVPYVIRSRVQIEAFVQIYVFSLSGNIVPFGLKTLISGGGYGSNLGLQQGNSGLSEGGLLSTACLMIVPLAVYLTEHGQLAPRVRLMSLAYWGIAALAIVTAIGTYERSALIGLVVLVAYMWTRSRHKVGFTLVAGLVVCLVIYATSSAWTSRISTIGDFQNDSSAHGRILVWEWTLGYVFAHPYGGGFAAYLINQIEIPASGTGPGSIEFARAFHSIYFEVLGEQGYPGLIMFVTVAAVTFVKLRRLAKRTRGDPELEWVAGLSNALQSGLAVFMTSGAFVGIAFQPMFWNSISISISLSAYMWRVEHNQGHAAIGMPGVATVRLGGPHLPAPTSGWRHRAAGPTNDISPSRGGRNDHGDQIDGRRPF
jgi:putative inorganic carbon (HCO3(-)) transporter